MFAGARVQRGHGLGNLFSGLIKAAMPLVKSGVKALGKQGLKTGMQIAGDIVSGQKPKRAVKTRIKQAGTHMVSRALNRFPPGIPTQVGRGRQKTSRGGKRGTGRGRQQTSRGRGRQQSSRRGTKRGASSRGGSSSRSKQPRDIFT